MKVGSGPEWGDVHSCPWGALATPLFVLPELVSLSWCHEMRVGNLISGKCQWVPAPHPGYSFRLRNPRPTRRRGTRPAAQHLISSVVFPRHAPHSRSQPLPSPLNRCQPATLPPQQWLPAAALSLWPTPPATSHPKVPRQAMLGSQFTMGHWPLWEIFCFSSLEPLSIFVHKYSGYLRGWR